MTRNKLQNQLLVLLMTLSLSQTQIPQPYKLTPLSSSSGIVFQIRGKAKVSIQHFNLLNYYNLTHINEKINILNNFYKNSEKVCLLRLSSQFSNECRNQMRYIKTKVQTIIGDFQTVSHQINVVNRNKRGIFNGIGDGLKWLFGVPDADDAQFYTDSIKSLINNQKQTDVLMQQQIGIISETITNFNNSLIRMNENVDTLNKNIVKFNKFSNQMLKAKEMLELEVESANHILLLVEMTDELQTLLKELLNDLTFIQNGIVSFHALPPEQLYNELLKASTKFHLPIAVTIDNVYYYYKIIEFKAFIQENLLIMSFEIPIATMFDYDFYEMFPLPTPHSEDPSLFSFIEPTKRFVLLSTTKLNFIMFDDMSKCTEVFPGHWICKSLPTIQKVDDHICEIDLLLGSMSHIPKSCKIRNMKAQMELWHPLEKNNWLYVTSVPSQMTILCGKEISFSETVTGMGKLELQPGCKAYTRDVILETSTTLTIVNGSSQIPITDITEEECCKKLHENITLNAIHLDPIKFANFDLNEVNYAKKKLNEFDEQLQQQLNKPFIIKNSSWYTTLLSALFSLVALIILYNVLKWCGWFQFLRKYMCCTKEPRSEKCCNPCLQIFNQCNTRATVTPMTTRFHANDETIEMPPVLQIPPSSAQRNSETESLGSSLRRSARLKKIRINAV